MPALRRQPPRRNDSARAARYRRSMIGSNRIEGYAIISADGMIADAGGKMPDTIATRPTRISCRPNSTAPSLSCTGGTPRGRAADRGLIRGAWVGPALVHADIRSRRIRVRCCGTRRARRSTPPSRRSESRPGRSPLSAGLRFSNCSCHSTTHFTSRSPNAPEFPPAGRCSRKSGRMQPRRRCSRATACGLIRRATSTRPRGSR